MDIVVESSGFLDHSPETAHHVDKAERWVILDYAPRTGYVINVNWNYVVIGSVAATVLTWLGYVWATLLPGDFATVTNGMLTSTAGGFVGGLLLLLTLASFIWRIPKPGWYRLGVV